MAEDQDKPAEPPPRQGYIPRPPTPAELDQISRDQGLITDEWTGEPAGTPAPEEQRRPRR